jgi:PPOX class probable F420-dependent enzyme
VWVDVDEDGISFNTAVDRAKDRYLREDPRVSLLVIDSRDPYRWVAVEGSAELSLEGATEQIDRLAKKYTGRDTYSHVPGETRITVRIRPERIESHGLG